MTTLHAISGHLAPLLAPALAWLARSGMDAALIAALVFGAQVALGRWLTPRWRYRLWGLVVLRLMLPVLPASPTSLWNLHVAAPVRNLFTTPAESRSIQPAPEPPLLPAPRSGLTVKVFVGPLDPSVVAPSLPRPASPPAPKMSRSTEMPATRSRLPPLLAFAWLGGVVLLLTRLVISNLAFARRLRGARLADEPKLLEMLAECGRLMRVSRVPPILVTEAVRGPAAAGVWRRRILLPSGLFDTLSPAEQRTVLLHELAHVRCRDVAANWLLAVLQAVHWFNPVLWLAFARLRADRELARDAMVLAVTATGDTDDESDGTAARRYAQTLLRLTERLSARPPLPASAAAAVAGIVSDTPWSSPLVPALFGGRRTALQRRLRMISRLSNASARRFTFVGPALLLALGCGTLTQATGGEPAPAAGQPQQEQPQKQPATPPNAIGAGQPVDPIRELRTKARRLIDDGRYREALAVVDQLLAVDARDDYGVGVRPLLEDKIALATQRDAKGRQEAADALQAKLDRKLPEVRFDGVGFQDAVEFFRDTTGVNLFVNWKALEAAGINRKAPVTARMYNVKFSKALQVILDSVSTPTVRLSFVAEDGVITVSTREELQKGDIVTRVYDIRDLVVAIPDFEPGEGLLGLGPTTKPSDPRAGQQNPQGPGMPHKTRDDLVKDVVKLVTDTVATDTWRDNGGTIGSIRELSGQLIVTQLPENHQLLAKLLEQLRETRGIQVTVEARFVTCDEDVLMRLLKEWGKTDPAATKPIVLPEPPAVHTRGRTPAGVFLNEKQVSQLLAAAQNERESVIVSAPRMTLFNGQRAYVLASTQQPYVQDYVAIAKGGEVRYEPVTGIAQAGVMTDLQATVSADRRYVTLSIHPKLTSLLGMNTIPWEGRPAGSNLTVQVPDMKTTEMRTTVSVPDGGTVLLGGLEYPGGAAAGPTTAPSTRPATTQPARNMVLLVKPRLLLQQDRPEQKQFPAVQPPTSRSAE